jgi:hypothetical protein
MGTAIERLKAFARAAVQPLTSLERRILAETGLPVVWEGAADPMFAKLRRELEPMAHADDYAGLAAAFDQLFAEKRFCGNGYRTYRAAYELLLARIETAAASGDPALAETELASYDSWWQQDRSNVGAAAIYARALTAVGYAWRGAGWATEVDEAHWAKLRDYCGQARAVLAHAGPQGRKHWLWRQADFTLTFVAWGCNAEDEDMLLPTFAGVQTLDPHEFGIYDDRALHLLPRWAGNFTAIDQFARASADRTAAQFGDLLYARIYDNILGFEDPESTLVDPVRLMRGFADWYQRFPSQALANRHAAHANAFGDDATVEHLFRTTLREIHPAHWFDHDQPLESWRRIGRGRRSADNVA